MESGLVGTRAIFTFGDDLVKLGAWAKRANVIGRSTQPVAALNRVLFALGIRRRLGDSGAAGAALQQHRRADGCGRGDRLDPAIGGRGFERAVLPAQDSRR
jgi:hypothetical protein